jgi:methylmalonyl-CoA/ethylmalonyl-CoA epimerase
VRPLRIHHLAWLVHSIETARAYFEGKLDLAWEGVETFESKKIAFLRVGETIVELIEPGPEPSAMRSAVEEVGDHLHHIAYEVEDVAAALREAGEKGLDVLDAVPRPGIRGWQIGFVDSHRSDRLLEEFVQVPKALQRTGFTNSIVVDSEAAPAAHLDVPDH